MIKRASAVWHGGSKQGGGFISTESGALEGARYAVDSRFDDNRGTSPEELLGAAHAGCFSMALSLILGEAGFTPQEIETRAAVTLDKSDGGFAITSSHLDVTATIPGIDQVEFAEIANKAKIGCPVSKVLKAKISMNAQLMP